MLMRTSSDMGRCGRNLKGDGPPGCFSCAYYPRAIMGVFVSPCMHGRTDGWVQWVVVLVMIGVCGLKVREREERVTYNG